MVRLRVLISALGVACYTGIVFAQTSYPMIMATKPVAAQSGQTSDHTVFARYSLDDAYQVLVSGDGVTGEILPEEEMPDEKTKEEAKKDGKKRRRANAETLKVRFTVAANAKPGVRDYRIATPRGVSTVGQLVVVRDPVVSEADKNNTPAEAQSITVPATICGVIEAIEDLDIYKFKVNAGQSLSFHVRGLRLCDRIHDLQEHLDPILTLRSAAGATLATADNDFAGDPFLSYRFQEAGEYLLEVRDVRYKGNPYWNYSVEISERPFVIDAFPLAVARGSESKLELIGAQLPKDPNSSLIIPPNVPLGLQSFSIPTAAGETNPVLVLVSSLPMFLESTAENNTPATAMMITAPAAVSGRIETEGDVDCYAFDAKKGERFSVEVTARRAQSPLDSALRILNDQGSLLAENDDLGKYTKSDADSWFENWTAPADGRYVVEVRDLLLRGGNEFVYALELTRAEPYFELYLDTDKTQVPAGTAGVMYAVVVRKNGFDSDVQLKVEGLPQGVTAACGRIPAGGYRDGCIIFKATADAPTSVANITVTGTATWKQPDGSMRELTVTGIPRQETYLPGGGRGHWPVEAHAVCVTAPSDIRSVKLSTYDLSLKPGESKRIDVTIERAPEFKQNVTLDPIFQHLGNAYGNTLPAGVTVDAKNSKTLLTGTETQGHITLVAAANASPIEKMQVSMMANISLNFVMKATYSSDPLFVTTVKP